MELSNDFLAGLQVVVSTAEVRNGAVREKVKTERIRKEKVKREEHELIPQNADLRVFADGLVVPSKEFVDKYNLQFKLSTALLTADSDMSEFGNGVDLVNTQYYPQYPLSFKNLSKTNGKKVTPEEHERRILENRNRQRIFAMISPRDVLYIDLFNNGKYYTQKDLDKKPELDVSMLNKPKSNVFKGVHSPLILDMLKDVYGIELEENTYIDLVVDTTVQFRPNPITAQGTGKNCYLFSLPKVKGGLLKTEIRKVYDSNTCLMPLMPTPEFLHLINFENAATTPRVFVKKEVVTNEYETTNETVETHEETEVATEETNEENPFKALENYAASEPDRSKEDTIAPDGIVLDTPTLPNPTPYTPTGLSGLDNFSL